MTDEQMVTLPREVVGMLLGAGYHVYEASQHVALHHEVLCCRENVWALAQALNAAEQALERTE